MKHNLILISTAFILGALLTISHVTFAQAGSLDLSFGDDGIVTTSFGEEIQIARAVAIQDDGKILVAGDIWDWIGSGTYFREIALSRYDTDGNLDNTFDNDGKVTTSIGTFCGGYSLAIQSDGKILLSGSVWDGTKDDFALLRYHMNGSLDSTFDTDGIVTTPFDGNSAGYAVAIQSDGKIVVAGSCRSRIAIALARYNLNGSLDTTFDNDGKVMTPADAGYLWGYAIAIQPDGKILVAGKASLSFALARFNINGSLDTTFGSGGIVTTQIGVLDAQANSVTLQSDGKILVAGYSDYDFAIVRYDINGELDVTFDTDGIVITPVGVSSGQGHSLAIQPDGSILVAGGSRNGSHDDFTIVRYTVNGSLDTTFDSDGIVYTSFGPEDSFIHSMALQSDGKIVVAGEAYNGSNFDFALARYNNSSSLGIRNANSQTAEIKIFPNPFSDLATFQSDTVLKESSLIIYNLYGEKVKQINNLNGQTVYFHRDNLPSGLYFLQVNQGNNPISVCLQTKFVIID
jgi:uncharacterized delta-60 repeat protein